MKTGLRNEVTHSHHESWLKTHIPGPHSRGCGGGGTNQIQSSPQGTLLSSQVLGPHDWEDSLDPSRANDLFSTLATTENLLGSVEKYLFPGSTPRVALIGL